jgi:hypothetical protein
VSGPCSFHAMLAVVHMSPAACARAEFEAVLVRAMFAKHRVCVATTHLEAGVKGLDTDPDAAP